MNFVLAAGGTGGHMIPAHALAAELKSRGHGVLLITDERGARFPGLFEGVPVHILPAGRLSGGPIGWLKAAKSIYAGRAMASRMYETFRDKQDGCIKVVIKPGMNGNGHRPNGFGRADTLVFQARAADVARGSVYITLDRLVRKGYLQERAAPGGADRAGRPRRIFRVTPLGTQATREALVGLRNMQKGLAWLTKE